MTTLAQLGKSAATALGIPNRSDVGDLTKLKPGLVDFVIQHHKADKAGPHYDVRFGTPETGLYSWATKHELPEPGARRALFQQPVHTHEYAGFQGEIPSGYGKGTVATKRRGNILVTASSPDKIEFTTNDKEQPERFVLLKPKAWKDKGWLLINRTAVRPDLTKLGQQSYPGPVDELRLVHYSHEPRDVLRPLTYTELLADRSRGRWESQLAKAKAYVESRRKFEKYLHKRLADRGVVTPKDSSFLYATLADHEQFGPSMTRGRHRHESQLTPDVIDKSFFDVVGTGKSYTAIGSAGLQKALSRWSKAKEQGLLRDEEYMGMTINPRIEVITPAHIKPNSIQPPDLTKLGQQSYNRLYNRNFGDAMLTLFEIGQSAKQAADDGILYPSNLNPVTRPIYKELTMPKEEAELAPFGKPLYKFSPSPTGTIHGSVKSLANDLYSNPQTVNEVVTRLMGLPLQANALTGEVPNPANMDLMTSDMTDLTKKYPGVPPEHLAGLIAQQTDTIASRTARQSKLIASRLAPRAAVQKAVAVPPQYPNEDVSSAGPSYDDYNDPSAAMAAAKRKQQVWQQTPLDWKRRPTPSRLPNIAARLLPYSPVFPRHPGSNNQGYFKPYLNQ